VVFTGTMLPGPTADLGRHRVLVSPARVLVTRYLKGHGPKIVTVATAVARAGDSGTVVSEDGIQPRAGQHWTIYSSSPRVPYDTSICGGSSPGVPTTVMANFPTARLSFYHPRRWHSYRYRETSSFTFLLAFLSTDRLRAPCTVKRNASVTRVSCGSPLSRLSPGGVLITWVAEGMPGLVCTPAAEALMSYMARCACTMHNLDCLGAVSMRRCARRDESSTGR
jgi:hypothetical protein